MVELLECRLLASASLHDGVIVVKGTKGTDVIRVERSSDLTGLAVLFTINDEPPKVWSSPRHFDTKGPRWLVIRSYRGDDDIVVSGGLFAPTRPLKIDAGPGDDRVTIRGPRHAATVDGGTGDDVITAYPGNGDKLSGGPGNDILQTYSPNLDRSDEHYVARLDEPSGFEGLEGSTLVGGDGDDTLIGSIFNDRLVGGPGKDALFGDEGKDTLKGGADNDCYLKDIEDTCTPTNEEAGLSRLKDSVLN